MQNYESIFFIVVLLSFDQELEGSDWLKCFDEIRMFWRTPYPYQHQKMHNHKEHFGS